MLHHKLVEQELINPARYYLLVVMIQINWISHNLVSLSLDLIRHQDHSEEFLKIQVPWPLSENFRIFCFRGWPRYQLLVAKAAKSGFCCFSKDNGLPWGMRKPIVLGDRAAENVHMLPLDRQQDVATYPLNEVQVQVQVLTKRFNWQDCQLPSASLVSEKSEQGKWRKLWPPLGDQKL